ncbi:hypothetical protein YB2330_000120 [Saitoella coloradoensis]
MVPGWMNNNQPVGSGAPGAFRPPGAGNVQQPGMPQQQWNPAQQPGGMPMPPNAAGPPGPAGAFNPLKRQRESTGSPAFGVSPRQPPGQLPPTSRPGTAGPPDAAFNPYLQQSPMGQQQSIQHQQAALLRQQAQLSNQNSPNMPPTNLPQGGPAYTHTPTQNRPIGMQNHLFPGASPAQSFRQLPNAPPQRLPVNPNMAHGNMNPQVLEALQAMQQANNGSGPRQPPSMDDPRMQQQRQPHSASPAPSMSGVPQQPNRNMPPNFNPEQLQRQQAPPHIPGPPQQPLNPQQLAALQVQHLMQQHQQQGPVNAQPPRQQQPLQPPQQQPPGDPNHPPQGPPRQGSGSKASQDGFLRSLAEFMQKRGTPIRGHPIIGGKQIHLYNFWQVIQRHGGPRKLSLGNGWHSVANVLGVPGTGDLIAEKYQEMLAPFADHILRQQLAARKAEEARRGVQSQGPLQGSPQGPAQGHPQGPSQGLAQGPPQGYPQQLPQQNMPPPKRPNDAAQLEAMQRAAAAARTMQAQREQQEQHNLRMQHLQQQLQQRQQQQQQQHAQQGSPQLQRQQPPIAMGSQQVSPVDPRVSMSPNMPQGMLPPRGPAPVQPPQQHQLQHQHQLQQQQQLHPQQAPPHMRPGMQQPPMVKPPQHPVPPHMPPGMRGPPGLPVGPPGRGMPTGPMPPQGPQGPQGLQGHPPQRQQSVSQQQSVPRQPIPPASPVLPAAPPKPEVLEYVPKKRALQTHGGFQLDLLNRLGATVRETQPGRPKLRELGNIHLYGLNMSIQSGLNGEISYALDILNMIAGEPSCKLPLVACGDLLESLVELANDMLDELVEAQPDEANPEEDNEDGEKPYSLKRTYDEMMRDCMDESTLKLSAERSGGDSYKLRLAAERSLCITGILRNFSFFTDNQLFMADEQDLIDLILRYLSVLDLAPKQTVLLTQKNMLMMWKDLLVLLSNLAAQVRLPSVEAARTVLDLLLMFAPASPFSEDPEHLEFTTVDVSAHPYAPAAIDVMAKLLARDHNVELFTKVFNEAATASVPKYAHLTHAFALCISAVPEAEEDMQPRSVERRMAMLEQGLLAGISLARMCPTGGGVAQSWMTAGYGLVGRLLKIVLALSDTPAGRGPRYDPGFQGLDNGPFSRINKRILKLLKILASKSGPDMGEEGIADKRCGSTLITTPAMQLGVLLLPNMDWDIVKDLQALGEEANSKLELEEKKQSAAVQVRDV